MRKGFSTFTEKKNHFLLLFLLVVPFLALLVPAARPAYAAPSLEISQILASGSSPAETGTSFTFRLSYRCASITEDCTNVVVTYPLAINGMEFVNQIQNSHIQSFSSAGGVATWTFKNPLGAGSTGQLDLTARFKNDGTIPDGYTANAQGTMTATGATDATTNIIVMEADAENTTYTASKTRVSPSNVIVENPTGNPVDATITYRVQVCQPSNSQQGGLDLTNITMTDTLPGAGAAEFQSATTQGGDTLTCDGGACTAGTPYSAVTWQIPVLDTGSGTQCASRDVTIVIPAGTFAVGASIANNMSVTGTPYGGSPITPLNASNTTTAQGVTPTPSATLTKSVSSPEMNLGGTVTYRLRAENDGNTPLDDFTLVDAIPDQVEVTQIRTLLADSIPVTLSYQVDDGGWVTWGVYIIPNGLYTLDVSTLGLGAGQRITDLRWEYGTVPAGFDLDQDPTTGFRATVTSDTPSNPFNNTANLTWEHSGTPDSDSDPVGLTVIPERPRIRVEKSVQSGNPAYEGSTVRYRLRLRNDSYTGTPLENPVLADLLPPDLEYIGNLTSSGTMPDVEQIDNYGGTQTLLRFHWDDFGGDGPTLSLADGSDINLEFDVRVSAGASVGTRNNRGYLIKWGNPPIDQSSWCQSIQSDSSDLDSDTNTAEQFCASSNTPVNVVIAQPQVRVEKSIISGSPAYSGDIVRYQVRLVNNSQTNTALVNPVLGDLLQSGMEYVGNVAVSGNGGAPDPYEEVIPDYNGTGRTLVRFRWDGTPTFSLPGDDRDIRVQFDVRVGASVLYGTETEGNRAALIEWDNPTIDITSQSETTTVDVNDLDGDTNTTEEFSYTNNNDRITVNAIAQLDSVKWVKGQLDANWHRYPESGLTVRGGTIEYRMEVENTGNVPMRNTSIVDVLPYVGDTGVIDPQARLSVWQPQFTQLIEVPAGVVVYYSEEQNPCRNATYPPNLFPSLTTPTCTDPQWTTVPPADSTRVRAFRVDFGTTILNPADKVEVRWLMHAPVDAPVGEIAWNSFGYIATRTDTGTDMLPAEPIKVGIEVEAPPVSTASYGNYVWVDANDNNIQDDAPANGVNLVQVNLYTPGPNGIPGDGDDIPIRDTLTANNFAGQPGYYLFDGLTPGNYYARFYPPVGYGVVLADQGGDDTVDSDVVFDNGIYRTDVTTLVAGENDLTWDMGLYVKPTAAIGNYVWFDENGDGVQNDGASNGINGVRVELLQGGSPISETVTTDDVNGNPGYYLFDDLTPGTYSLRFHPPTGATFTTPNLGGNDTADSDANTGTGETTTTTLVAGEYDSTWDAGLIMPTGPLSLGNRVWFDADNDGRYEPGGDDGATPGINGVRVDLYRDINTNGEPDASEYYSTVSTYTSGGVPGYYNFTGLPAGDYLVVIHPDNFLGGAPLNGLASSTGGNPANEADPNSDIDSDDNGIPRLGYRAISNPVTLTDDGEPINDGDTNPDSNMSIDFGFYPVVALGNLVWNDANNNGVVDTGEGGIPNVTVALWQDDGDGTPEPGGDDTFLSDQATDAGGSYRFEDLPAGDYFVVISPTNFLEGGTLYHFRSSTGGSSEPAPDPDSDEDDNDDNGTESGSEGVVSKVISLAPGTETANDGDGNDSTNFTLDFGLYTLSLGNRVWHDENNNGIIDGAETGFDGVAISLYQDANSDGQITGSETTPVSTTTTSGGGYYLFDHLLEGDYQVVLDTSNFTSSGVLVGYTSSTGANGATSGDYEPGRDVDTDPTDSDDNGTISGVLGSTGRISSAIVTLTPGGEPTSESDLGPDGSGSAGNSASNLTVDFGLFRALSLGNRVWYDGNNNGIIDGSETGIGDVLVNLYCDADDNGYLNGSETTPMSATTTDASGYYLFDNLLEGNYRVELDGSNFNEGEVLEGYTSSTGTEGEQTGPNEPAPDPDTSATDSDDNGTIGGTLGSTGSISSTMVTLAYDSEPTGEGDLGTAGSGNARNINSNLTVDFGVLRPFSLGNRVWHDENNNGILDDGEEGIPEVLVNLYHDADGNGYLNGSETTPIRTQETDDEGYYLFDYLLEGNYLVELDPINFSEHDEGMLVGYTSSTGVNGGVSGPYEPAPDPNPAPTGTELDRDDNGTIGGVLGSSTGSISSTMVTLSNRSEPEDEPDPDLDQGPDGAGSADDNNSNLTVDFGLFRPLSLGNRVWYDHNNNGVIDEDIPEELGISEVTINLYLDVNEDGELTGDETEPIAWTTTDENGYYLFDNLLPGDYILEVDVVNFVAGGVLIGHISSTGADDAIGPYEPAPDPDTDEDEDDNGTRGEDGHVRSAPVTLSHDEEPDEEEDLGPRGSGNARNDNSNLTVDFGILRPFNIGNRVWNDKNNNGIMDLGEPGFDGVLVNLYHDINGDGQLTGGETIPVNTTTTHDNGYYLFDHLLPGVYLVEIAPENFEEGEPLEHYISSTGQAASATGPFEPAPNADTNATDRDDNGTTTGILGSGGIIRATAVGLDIGEEPVGESDLGPERTGSASDNNSNLTVDFGLFRPLSLGNRVWHDRNNNGAMEPDEHGISNVIVHLYRDSDGNEVLEGGETIPIASMMTNDNGYYLFDYLRPGLYLVELAEENFIGTGVLKGYTSSIGTNDALTGPYEPAADVDSDPTDLDDNGTIEGILQSGGAIRSDFVNLSYDQEPTLEYDVGPFGSGIAIDRDSNLTADFGVFRLLSLGNRVWKDLDNDGRYEPDAGEVGINDVRLNLYRDVDGNGVYTPDTDEFIASTTTATRGGEPGYYLFERLMPGDYVVQIDPTNPALDGLASSTGNEPTPDPDNDADHDDNGDPQEGQGVLSQAVTLALDGEPTDDGDTDPFTNLTVDFGFYPLLTLGNYLWNDLDNDGLYEPGNGETGIDGVRVNLYRDTDENGVYTPGVDEIVDSTTSTAREGMPGYYEFNGLPVGDYIVQIDPANFGDNGVLRQFASSTGNDVNGVAPDPDDDRNDDDNGTPQDGHGVVSQAVTLTAGGEPTNDGDPDNTTNLTVDFGFYPLLSLGNRIWNDLDNDGLYEPGNGENGINGVDVNLYRDTDGNGTYTPGVDEFLSTTTTRTRDNVAGFYRFDDLEAGDYVVQIDPVNFGENGVLRHFASSTGNEPTPDPDNDADHDDNGDPQEGQGVVSQAVTLSYGAEPTNDGDTDRQSNLTVDFGFYPLVSLGDFVWLDENRNGLQDEGEFGVEGVTVELYDRTDTLIGTTTTDINGHYGFNGLVPGGYSVRFILPETYLFTTQNQGDNPATDSDADPVSGKTPLRQYEAGDQDLTWDAGVVSTLHLGDRVWHDLDNDGLYEPDSGETGIDGVLVNLYRDEDGSGGYTPGVDSLIASSTTATTDQGPGIYHFDNLAPGDYLVQIDPSNFAEGGVLRGLASSTGNDVGGTAPDPDDDRNDDDNGVPQENEGVVSHPVTLAGGNEPTNDGDDNPNTNLSVDFGFYPLLSLGNLVWHDLDNDGRYEPDSGETGIDGVVVNLYRDTDGNGAYSPGVDTFIAATTTATVGGQAGFYRFDDLPVGDYLVRIDQANFAEGGPLYGLANSTGNNQADGMAPDPDDDADHDDNGDLYQEQHVVSRAVTLWPGTEPVNDGDEDAESNLTVDFGFYPLLTIGNRIWNDLDNDGTYEPGEGERGIDGVRVNLYRDTDGNGVYTPGVDAFVASTVSATSDGEPGIYRFEHLPAGDYMVQIDPENFADGGVLYGMTSSQGNEVDGVAPDPDNDVDHDDNGYPFSGYGAVSWAVSLAPGSEPTNDGDSDPNTNLSIDFGFVDLEEYRKPDIEIHKTVSVARIVPNQVVTYTIDITNTGYTVMLSPVVLTTRWTTA
ncbi:MAG: hypothetical protein HC884_04035 [Chloroflexaceae bacterium]|nr:hypothetical protein [Chloroflexaceae bacterium]